jgi:hypothetical protein
MRVSFNEIEMTVLKAARGAGMEWGLAEEAAYCARWLALFDLPWQRAVLASLQVGDWRGAVAHEGHSFRPCSPFEWLCPIKAGAYLSDLGEDGPDLIERVKRPILLVPFAARIAGAVRLSWGGASVWLDARGPAVSEDSENLDPPCVDRVTIVEAACVDWPALPRRRDPTVDLTAWRVLKCLEHKTYVPASLRSRLGGAGPATGDND